jgi:secondary thiamine-phosphate synthase enzyme
MKRFTIDIATEGNGEVVNLSPMLVEHLKGHTGDGLVHLFINGSTAAIATLEYEPGLVKHDLPNLLQRLIPDDMPYQHEATWHDDNGHSHLRSTMLGTSLTVPISNGKALTGEWQQVVLIDFDTRPRRRQVIGTVVG